jgi:hypothetical protein
MAGPAGKPFGRAAQRSVFLILALAAVGDSRLAGGGSGTLASSPSPVWERANALFPNIRRHRLNITEHRVRMSDGPPPTRDCCCHCPCLSLATDSLAGVHLHTIVIMRTGGSSTGPVKTGHADPSGRPFPQHPQSPRCCTLPLAVWPYLPGFHTPTF